MKKANKQKKSKKRHSEKQNCHSSKENTNSILYASPEAMELILYGKMDKYFKLVSYARKGGPDHPMWNDCPEHIKQGAFNTMAKTEEMYPDEVDELKDPEV